MEEQVLIHQLQQHEPHQLTHILATDELLVPGQSAIGSSPAGRSLRRRGHEGRCDAVPRLGPAHSRLYQLEH